MGDGFLRRILIGAVNVMQSTWLNTYLFSYRKRKCFNFVLFSAHRTFLRDSENGGNVPLYGATQKDMAMKNDCGALKTSREAGI